jgi:hypothetical protein
MDINLSNVDASFFGAATAVAGAGDVNGDGYDDILLGNQANDERGTMAGKTYLIFGKKLGWSMNTNLSNANASFLGEDWNDYSGKSVAGAGDVNGDGYDDILIGAYRDEDGGPDAGQTYLILGKASGWSKDTVLSNADASFWGEEDLDQSGFSIAGAGDVNGDGFDDILIGARTNKEGGGGSGQTYLILGKASGWSMDTDLSNVDASFWGEGGQSGYSVAGAGDINSDGYDDILIGALVDSEAGEYAGKTHLIFGKASGWSMDTDLSIADGSFLGEIAGDRSGGSVAGAGDFNGDGYDDMLIGAHLNDEGGSDAGQTYLIILWQIDTDNDGVHDGVDTFPLDIAASIDTDGDGFPDEWNDGKTQVDSTTGLRLDAFPLDIAASLDNDGDGYPDEWNPGMSANDSTSDPQLMLDALPVDPLEWNDTDGDGHGDNSDAFPEDPLEWTDTDGDTYGDNSDPFPEDPNEWSDIDGDGHGDNYADIFPNDPLEWADLDGDDYGDNGDAFPENPFEWLDTDDDGHGDNGDAFPDDPLEWNDTDGDGHGDNGDVFPTNKNEWVDTDGDGSGDNGDAFPDDPAASVDTDGDGYPDEWNAGKSKEDSTTGLKLDLYPANDEKWKEEGGTPSLGLVGALMAILVSALVAYNRRMHSWGKGAS